MKYKHKCRFSLPMALIVIACMLFASCGQPTAPPENPDPPSLDNQAPEIVRNMVLSYLREKHDNDGTDGAVYFAADEPDEPQESDFRIDSIIYAGETRLYETIGVAYEVAYSGYHFLRKDADDEGAYLWSAGQPYYVVLSRSGYDNSWDRVLGFNYTGKDKKIEDVIVEVAYMLMDIEVSLNLDGYPQYAGPGSAPNFFNEEPDKEILKKYEPIYSEGDYWLRLNYKDLAATCYYNAQKDIVRINSIETTRTDVATHRGIRIGMTRDEVLSAYPDIYDTQYWCYDGDYLWYCDNDDGWGAALLFYFQNDIVTKIQLINMFD